MDISNKQMIRINLKATSTKARQDFVLVPAIILVQIDSEHYQRQAALKASSSILPSVFTYLPVETPLPDNLSGNMTLFVTIEAILR